MYTTARARKSTIVYTLAKAVRSLGALLVRFSFAEPLRGRSEWKPRRPKNKRGFHANREDPALRAGLASGAGSLLGTFYTLGSKRERMEEAKDRILRRRRRRRRSGNVVRACARRATPMCVHTNAHSNLEKCPAPPCVRQPERFLRVPDAGSSCPITGFSWRTNKETTR